MTKEFIYKCIDNYHREDDLELGKLYTTDDVITTGLTVFLKIEYINMIFNSKRFVRCVKCKHTRLAEKMFPEGIKHDNCWVVEV